MDIAQPTPQRIWLDETSWVDHMTNWLGDSADIFCQLRDRLSWHQEQTRMHKPAPRLSCWIGMGWSQASGYKRPLNAADWDPVTAGIARILGAHYGRRFNSILANRYRDGADSISPHAYNEARLGENPVICGVSLGATRTFRLVPQEGVRSSPYPPRSFELSCGDLLVMGGTTDHRWFHSVPKVTRPIGERIGLTVREYQL